MLNNSVRLFTIRGIEIGVHYSWLIVFALVTWSLSVYVFPREATDLSTVDYWVLGAITSLLLFASVLIHELSHSFVALSRGLEAKSITLFIFGGVSNLSGDAEEPSTEFWVAIVGPLASFVLAALAWVLAAVVSEPRFDLVASYLVYINVSLGLFNLVPGFPLDGGRVLRAILWRATGDQGRATTWAGNAGKVVAWGMFAIGGLMIFSGQIVGGVWLAAIAWFLHSAASSGVQQQVLESRLAHVKVGDVVKPVEVSVMPGASIAELIDDYLLPYNLRAVPVVDGRLVGIITVGDVMRVPAAVRRAVTVGEVMGGRERLRSVAADALVQDAIDLLTEDESDEVVVMDGDRFAGFLTQADVMRQLQLREALDV